MKRASLVVAGLALAALGLVALARKRTVEKLSDEAPADAEHQRIRAFWDGYNLANSLRLRGDFAEAVPAYRDCLRLNSQHEDSLYYEGTCLEEMGEYAEAAATFRRLIALNPSSVRAFAELGNTLSLTAPGSVADFNQARDAYLRCIQINREQAGPFLRLGALDLNERHYDRALDHFRIAAGFGSPEGDYLVGYTLFLQGKYQAAVEPLRKVLESYAKDRKAAGRGVTSEGDLLPAPGKPLTPLEKAGLKSILLLYWTSQRLGGYPPGIPSDFRVSLPRSSGDGRVATAKVADSRIPPGRVAWSDADRKGRRLFAVVGPGLPVKLYQLERGQGVQFSEVTESAGLKGVRNAWDAVWVDYDRDGYPDLYLVRSGFMGLGRNALYHNNGDGTFTDVTAAQGLSGERSASRACFADFDGDGRDDLLEVGSSSPGRSAVRLFHNTGRQFVEHTDAAGFAGEGTAVDCAVADYNHDGRPDVFVLYWHRDAVLYANSGNGRFSDVTAQAGLNGLRGTGFSALFFDYNRDGFLDLLVTAHAPVEDVARSLLQPGYKAAQSTPRLFRNKHGEGFEEVTAQVGLNRCYGTMQALVADFNSDGWPDLLLVNGSLDSGRLEPSVVLRNIEGKEFREWLYLPGLDQPANFLGGAVAPLGLGSTRGIFLAANPALRSAQPATSFYITY